MVSVRKTKKTSKQLLGKAPSELSTVGLTSLRTNRHPNKLRSSNEKYMFILENDGNIVLYELHDKSYTVLWQSNTHYEDTIDYVLTVEEDGNLAAYKGSTKYWESKTNSTWSSWLKGHGKQYGPYKLSLNDYGEVHLKNNYGYSLWEIPLTKTDDRKKADAEEYERRLKLILQEQEIAERAFRQSRRSRRSRRSTQSRFIELTSNGFNRLDSRQLKSIQSPDQQFEFRLSSDGNITFQQNGRIVWQSNTHRSMYNRYSILLQEDGNLVGYENETTPYWATDTYTLFRGGDKINGPFKLSFQNNQLCLSNRYRVIWHV